METPISMCREARNTGFVVYMSFTMEPILLLSSFTVNWKSNPLTNSWTDGGGGRGGKRAFSHETTILPWYRLAISYRCCDESFAFRRGEEIPEFLRDKGKQRPRMVSLIRFLVPFRKFVHGGRRTKREKCGKNVVLLTIHDREIFIFSIEFGIVSKSREILGWGGLSYKGNESRDREKEQFKW